MCRDLEIREWNVSLKAEDLFSYGWVLCDSIAPKAGLELSSSCSISDLWRTCQWPENTKHTVLHSLLYLCCHLSPWHLFGKERKKNTGSVFYVWQASLFKQQCLPYTTYCLIDASGGMEIDKQFTFSVLKSYWLIWYIRLINPNYAKFLSLSEP